MERMANGAIVQADADPQRPLLWVLRDVLSKIACDGALVLAMARSELAKLHDDLAGAGAGR